MSSGNEAFSKPLPRDQSAESSSPGRVAAPPPPSQRSDADLKATGQAPTITKANSSHGTDESDASSTSTNSSSNTTNSSNKTNSSEHPSSSDAELRATSEVLVKKLLQLSSPRMDIKIATVLLHEGVMDILMAHVSRLDPKQKHLDLSKCDLDKQIEYASRPRDTHDLEATKRSYHAMELLCGTSANHYYVQDSCFNIIVKNLFDTLLPSSSGNLNHFGKIFQHFVRRHPCDMIDFVIVQDNATRFFDLMLPLLANPPIADAILSIIFLRETNADARSKRTESFKLLSKRGLLQWFIVASEKSNPPYFADSAQELFLRIIEEASQTDNANELFELVDSEGGFFSRLKQHIVSSPPSKSRKQLINILRNLCTSGSPPTRASSMSHPIQGPLYNISHRIREKVSVFIPDLCRLILNDYETPTAHVKGAFTTEHLNLLEIIYYSLPDALDKHDILAKIPDGFWRWAILLFVDKRTSSIYHTIFYKIFYLLISINNEAILIKMFQVADWFGIMVDQYSNPEKGTDTHGFLNLMLNHVRLTSDADPGGYIHRLVSAHERYQSLLPKLRADTLAQTEPKYAWKLDTCPRPAPHLGPTPPLRSSLMFTSYNAATLTLMSDEGDTMDDTNYGIDLGSDYAYCLGFDHPARLDGAELHSNYHSRRNSIHSASSGDSYYSENDSRPSSPTNISASSPGMFFGGLVFESLTPEEPTSDDIKKKKKKKKKKKTTKIAFDGEES
ncbi:hypothetical protein BX666DRAFT_1979135 [Dichotomocladium elegans]|nr:hypothetical protein BX666DRAFT_1979135 [Dichotomocladium elegans]